MKRLTVLYDPECELCRRARRWLDDQPSHVQLEFVPAGTPAAAERFPELDPKGTLKQITVVADDGRVWRGDGAWIMCLWALRAHRRRAQQFAGPALRPFVRGFVKQVADKRYRISSWLEKHPETVT